MTTTFCMYICYIFLSGTALEFNSLKSKRLNVARHSELCLTTYLTVSTIAFVKFRYCKIRSFVMLRNSFLLQKI